MNIDLLITPDGDAGLLCNRFFTTKATCVFLDMEEKTLSIEFKNLDALILNIPVEDDYIELLYRLPHIHIAAVMDGEVSQAYQTPLIVLGEAQRNQYYSSIGAPAKPLKVFAYFIKKCVLGQPIHRDDAGDESSLGCILGDVPPSSIGFAPSLQRQHTFEIAPNPNLGLNTPGMGLGGSGSSGGGSKPPPKKDDD